MLTYMVYYVNMNLQMKTDLQETLKNFGLSGNESVAYSTLIEYGQLSAKRIALLSKVPRVRTYQTLEVLCSKNLVIKKLGYKIIKFEAVHPEVLSSYITGRMRRLEQSKNSFESILPSIISSYNNGLNRPSISFYEGVEGFRKIYDDILAEGKPIYIIASSTKLPEYQKIIQEYKKRQEEVGIVRYAIVQRDNDSNIKYEKQDKKVKKILREDLDLPGQILIYGDRVAITNFTEEVSHFVIKNKSVSRLFLKMFSFIRENYYKKLLD